MPETASDWRAAHRAELAEKQRHIRQKLAQLRQFRALVNKWLPTMRNYRDWFAGLEASASDDKYFSVQSLIRMASITGHLNSLQAEFNAIDAPPTTGSGTVATTSSAPSGVTTSTAGPSVAGATAPGAMTDQQKAAATAEMLTARAGPLANSAPWELVYFIDPETSEAVFAGEYGVAITNVLCSPFTSLAASGFAEEIFNLSVALVKEHPEEFEALEKGWKDTDAALDDIVETLEGIDQLQMRQLEEQLEDVLHDYEAAYDGAQGADNTSARRLGQAARARPGQ